MLTTTVNFTIRRAPSRQIRARDTPNDGAANGSAGVNSAPDVDAGVNGAPHLGGQRCGDHEDRGDSTNYRKLAEHNLSLPRAQMTELPLGRVYQTGEGERDQYASDTSQEPKISHECASRLVQRVSTTNMWLIQLFGGTSFVVRRKVEYVCRNDVRTWRSRFD